MKTSHGFYRALFVGLLIYASGAAFSQTKKTPAKKVTSTAKTAAKKSASTANTKNKNTKPVAVKTSPVKKIPVKADTVIKNVSIVPPVKPIPLIEVKPTSREQEMMNEINTLRAKPADYSNYVNDYINRNDADADMKNAAKELVTVLKKNETSQSFKFKYCYVPGCKKIRYITDAEKYI